MLLNGILFLGLNFIAYSFVFPGPKGSKRVGYVLLVAAALAFVVQLEYRTLLSLDFEPQAGRQILLFGFALPVFLISIVYYRVKRNRMEKKTLKHPQEISDGND